MNQEQLMKQKIKYLEDRIEVMAKSSGSINKMLGGFEMTENKEQGFEDLEDKFRDADTMIREDGNELI